ncbi:hypothetical protein BJ138DRAFT_1005899 [Hygrophoropsis aurantiaca]|uniref:Uncharacterized protein n=1 Tax=Hygrophoropsis aurantiaca TaxID=72124 RepID=A0ACB8AFW4_9AGAM|nr:hypothetical protein BJ138DRAFT_1005899 [Hygrophoropsis aurantiaca]
MSCGEGYLTAKASEDWTLVLEVCERASANEANAKEASKALRREFKYAEPTAQLSAARLWAIMLRNASDVFLAQISSRKFIDALEEVLTSSRTSPVVRERLMEVLAAAAYICSSSQFGGKDRDKEGFRALWCKLKPADKPDSGIPFDTDDAMFSPPIIRPASQHSMDTPTVPGQPYPQDQPSPLLLDQALTNDHKQYPGRTRHRVIPPDEDIRRLFQECKIARGNAGLLTEALVFTSPGDTGQETVIREFYTKCRASQELIYTQIPWATAGAERSRAERSSLGHGRKRKNRKQSAHGESSPNSDDSPSEATVEEDLLAALLGANEVLFEALRMYDEFELLAVEKATEERSRREMRLGRQVGNCSIDSQYFDEPIAFGSPPHTPSPPLPSPPASPRNFDLPPVVPSQTHPLPRVPPSLSPSIPQINAINHYPSPPAQTSTPTLLAPPPPAPHGPRSPAQANLPSRTSSPERISARPSRSSSLDSEGDTLSHATQRMHLDGDDDEINTPIRPSAKALGKRRIVEDPEDTYQSDDYYHQHTNPYSRDAPIDSDSDDGALTPRHHATQYVYDAAAERTAQRIREGRVSVLVNGVH